MADPGQAARLGAAARAHALTFSFTRMVAAFEQIYLTKLAHGALVKWPRQDAMAKS